MAARPYRLWVATEHSWGFNHEGAFFSEENAIERGRELLRDGGIVRTVQAAYVENFDTDKTVWRGIRKGTPPPGAFRSTGTGPYLDYEEVE